MPETFYSCYHSFGINTYIVWFILAVEIIAIRVIYKIFSIKEKEALKKSKETSNHFLSLKANLKYWLFGNIISLIIGFFIIILCVLFEIRWQMRDAEVIIAEGKFFDVFSLVLFRYRVIIFCIALLLIGLLIKHFKSNLPLPYYSSISLLPVIIGYPSVLLISNFVWPGFGFEYPLYWFEAPMIICKMNPKAYSLILVFFFVCSSIIGGGAVDFCRYVKKNIPVIFASSHLEKRLFLRKIISKLSLYVKSWLRGSLITIAVAIPLLAIMFLFEKFVFRGISFPYTKNSVLNLLIDIRLVVFFYFSMFFGPYLGSLIIKIKRKDLPWYIYSSVGFIYVAVFYSVCCWFHRDNDIHSPPSDLSFLYYLLIVSLIASFLGGISNYLYRFFKRLRKNHL